MCTGVGGTCCCCAPNTLLSSPWINEELLPCLCGSLRNVWLQHHGWIEAASVGLRCTAASPFISRLQISDFLMRRSLFPAHFPKSFWHCLFLFCMLCNFCHLFCVYDALARDRLFRLCSISCSSCSHVFLSTSCSACGISRHSLVFRNVLTSSFFR